MPTYIKTGFWDKKAKAPDGWLDLNLFVETLIPPTPPSTNIYNSDGTLTGNRDVTGNNNTLSFLGVRNYVFNTQSGINLEIYSSGNFLQTRYGINVTGLKLDFANSTYQLGQITGGQNTRLIVGDSVNSYVQTTNGGVVKGLFLDFFSRKYYFGQFQGDNGTTLIMDDAAAFPVQIGGVNVTQNTSGAASGKFLKIKVNGADYVIELKNPS